MKKSGEVYSLISIKTCIALPTIAILSISSALSAQTATTEDTTTPAPAPVVTASSRSVPTDPDVVALPEFQVSTTADKGYRAANSVSATRIETPIKNLPFAISAFTPQFISDIGARDLWDVVQFAPSVTSSGREFNAGNSVYTVRGFDQSPQHDGFNSEGYIDTVTIDRVEVVKGPASVLYGQVAPGGIVNYITKRPMEKAAYTFSVKGGEYNYGRATADINQPIVPGTALFRVNIAGENGLEFWDHAHSTTTVIAPDLLLKFLQNRFTINVNWQRFKRSENAPAQYLPNVEVVGKPNASGVLPTAGALANAIDGSDPGFLGYYPLPYSFNYDSKNDTRDSRYDTVNVELNIKPGAGLTIRGNYNYNESHDSQKLTGLGTVCVDVPQSYLTKYGNAYNTAAAAFANDIFNDVNTATLAPHAQISRRNRLQEVWSWSSVGQVDMAGSYKFGSVKLKPLVGLYYNKGKSYNRVRQTGSNGNWNIYSGIPDGKNGNPPPINVPTGNPWDFKNLTTFPIGYDTSFDSAKIPMTTYSSNMTHDVAGYAILNASFFDDRLFFIGGARYNKSDTQTINFLAASQAASVGKIFNTHRTTPQAGLGWKITRDMLWYASYSQAYQQQGQALRVLGVTTTNSAKPKTSEGYETGIKTDFLNGRISSTIAVYQISQKDRVVTVNSFNATGGTISTDFQGTKDRSRGVEAEVTWSPLDNFQVYASVAEDDVRVINVPVGYEYYLGSHPEATVKTLANLWARYTVKTGTVKGMWIGAGCNYTGKKAQRVNNKRLFLGDDLLVNAALGYDWTWEGHKMGAIINWDNATDQEYFPANQQHGMPSRVSVTYKVTF